MNVNHGRTLYVGGLDEKVTTDVLMASFLPFGDLVDVQIPKDLESGKSRAFGFVEFDSAEDAAEAIDNMHESELLGRTITVNVAKAKKTTEGSRRAIWADDVWLLEHAGQTLDTKDDENTENPEDEHVNF